MRYRLAMTRINIRNGNKKESESELAIVAAGPELQFKAAGPELACRMIKRARVSIVSVQKKAGPELQFGEAGPE